LVAWRALAKSRMTASLAEPGHRVCARPGRSTSLAASSSLTSVHVNVAPDKAIKHFAALNGAVERCNGPRRYEFYAVYDLPTSVQALNPIRDAPAPP
jgi:hypothetical protein